MTQRRSCDSQAEAQTLPFAHLSPDKAEVDHRPASGFIGPHEDPQVSNKQVVDCKEGGGAN